MAVTVARDPASLPQRPLAPQPAKFSTTPGFERFGRWGERITVIRDGGLAPMAYAMANHPQRAELSDKQLWQDCCQTRRELTCEYQVVELDAPSFFLPAGESVFKVIENPIQLPDNPPQGVMMRHLEAMTAHPLAKFYLLEPVFTPDDGYRLLTADELREEAHGDRQDSQRLAKCLGWAYRSLAWSQARRRDLAALAMRTAANTAELLAKHLAPVTEPRRSRREGRFGRVVPRDVVGDWIDTEHGFGLTRDARRFRRAMQELQWRVSFDPILCFELPEEPGELWFEAHWYTGADGRRYVHY
ncbi:hypothetical protein [Aeoliella mucimassa]|uniref:Uncharacterized protein n=1 Tax=Aeoliella mucimassa TaxID=2527972 RepID=A0A518AMY5_9BACT|nr:hypothetical protein [Aeoliella mucimassa]QDU56051.1 hypothetical protein Pan181_22540 [Aeoliella mucimassa]